MATKPTEAQLTFIAKLAAQIGVEAPPNPQTKKAASAAIEVLLGVQRAKQAQVVAIRAAVWEAKKQAEADSLETVAPWKPGKQQVTGTILIAKVQYSDYGTQYKCLLRTDTGLKLWMSVPKGVIPNLHGAGWLDDLKGQVIAGTVNVVPKVGEAHFAFGSRPTGFTVCQPTQELVNA